MAVVCLLRVCGQSTQLQRCVRQGAESFSRSRFRHLSESSFSAPQFLLRALSRGFRPRHLPDRQRGTQQRNGISELDSSTIIRRVERAAKKGYVLQV
jgi:hypothetical protein